MKGPGLKARLRSEVAAAQRLVAADLAARGVRRALMPVAFRFEVPGAPPYEILSSTCETPEPADGG